MIFTSPAFPLFFLSVFCVYWALRNNRKRKVFLLCSSYFFYSCWDWRFLSLILLSTLIDFGVGKLLVSSNSGTRRRNLLLVSLISNFSVLGFFKYFNFFTESLVDLFQLLGVTVSPLSLDIILPVGISFYTFQSLSYTIDLYRKRIDLEKSLLDFSLYVAFFPQLVAGPIVRASEFLPQLKSTHSFKDIAVKSHLTLFAIGYFKKAVISDAIAGDVDAFFANPAGYDALSTVIGVLLYAIQIYCDFSGYTDMAIACAGLLGYSLCINFAHPYFATSIQDFWRRWHISLSTWLRDYLYISLGGSRGSTLFTIRNLMLTMLLGGLWHGAAWTFIIWGGLHGIALVIHRYNPISLPQNIFVKLLSTILTFYWVCVAWIFFRGNSLEQAIQISKSFVLLSSSGKWGLPEEYLVLIAALFLLHVFSYKCKIPEMASRLSSSAFALLLGLVVAFLLALTPLHYKPFIYFQF